MNRDGAARRPVIALTTDFGLADTFVAQMKGVILSVCPEATIVDLTHAVPPQDVATGAFLLETGVGSFPPETIHVVVVDPGVGTERRALAVRTARGVFVAPDNGVLTRVLEDDPPVAAHVISAGHYLRETVSPTFHGRDVFAPAAAWIARGTALTNLGPEAGPLVDLPRADHDLRPGRSFEVRVLHVDRFGNATLDLRESRLRPLLESGVSIRVETAAGEIGRLCRTYAEAPGGTPVLLFNSAGYLEIAIDRGSAADLAGLRPGVTVQVRLSASRVL